MSSPLTRRQLLALTATGVGLSLSGCTDESGARPAPGGTTRGPMRATTSDTASAPIPSPETSTTTQPPPPQPTASEAALLLALAQAKQLEATAARVRPSSALTTAVVRSSSIHAELLESTLVAREPRLLEALPSREVSQRPGTYRLAQVALDSTRADSIASACQADDDYRAGLMSMLAHRRVVAQIADTGLPPLDVGAVTPAEAAALLEDLHPVSYALEVVLARTALRAREAPVQALDLLDQRRERLIAAAGDDAPPGRLNYRLAEDGRTAASRRRLTQQAADTWLASAGTLLGKDRDPVRQTTAIALVVEATVIARLLGHTLPTWPGLP